MSTYTPPPPPPPPAQLEKPVVVVNPHFCVEYPVDVAITKKFLTVKEGTFTVTDINGNTMFTIKGKFLSIRDRRTLIDSAGTPILTFQQKIMTAHRRWNVFKGESTDAKDLIFTVKKSHLLQLATELDVILASNPNEDECDFRVKGSWAERACTIYLGKTNNIIAQMRKKTTVQTAVLGTSAFGVTVYPNVDYAFVVALVAILWEINEDRAGRD